ncbi:hypothetical protein GPJ56_002554 [Histomonas meleagridis]|uniref:uncharacterized protein n=1 Tax=Histomonas meleagridis TaxID=135588 RepID=UPI00355AC7BD|nr:hypothetical protein GPJ56_002554 [Histomonas meleagridis]KAH0801346.1 hypothetical protein GO595_005941 [Histomonas meleagridis]
METKCTLYISKHDGAVRPKIVRITLHRYSDSQEPKIYGKLSVDVGKAFLENKTITEKIEMESGRSIPPVISISYSLSQIGNSEEGNYGKDDVSFVEEPAPKIPLNEWDKTEIESVKEKHHKKRRKSKKVKRHQEETPATVSESTNEAIVSQDDFYDSIQYLKTMMSKDYTNTKPSVFIDEEKKIPFPLAVFPIYGLFLNSKILTTSVTNDDFELFVETFVTEFDNSSLCSPESTDTKFLIILLLYLLVSSNPTNQGVNPDRTKQLLDTIYDLIYELAKTIVSPLVLNFEVICNRFVTARFDTDQLLIDFDQVLSSVQTAFSFTPSINRYLFNILVSLLDAKLSNKVLSNPSRYLFMNSVVWNSFITAFETMEKSDLTLLREITSILVMSPSIIDNPNETEIFSVISPDIDPKIIIHMLRNVNVDGVVLNSNDFKTICAKMNVDETAKYNPVKPFVVKDLNINNDELNLKDWCSAYVITTLREYPFLRSYAKKKQMI